MFLRFFQDTTEDPMPDSPTSPDQRLPLRWDAPLALPLWWLLTAYRRWLTRLLPPACRFHPSCSAYAREALQRYAVHRAVPLVMWRLLRCQPLCKGGLDPVPALLLVQFARQSEAPFFVGWVNRGLDPATRATVLSSVSQGNALGQLGGGPIFAVLAGAGGAVFALLAGAGIILPAIRLVRSERVVEVRE